MMWKNIRLELARTGGLPNGSVSRCYLLRLPVDEGGRIDHATVGEDPLFAIVRRFWPSSPDLRGHVVRAGRGLAFFFHRADDAPLLRHQPGLEFGNDEILLIEPDGSLSIYGVTEVNAPQARAAQKA